MTLIDELERLLAESEALSPGPWYGNDQGVYADNVTGVADTHEDVDTRLIVAMRNALPALLEAAKVLASHRSNLWFHDNAREVIAKLQGAK